MNAITNMFKSPKKPDTSAQEELLKKQEQQLDQQEQEAADERAKRAAGARASSGRGSGILTGVQTANSNFGTRTKLG